MSDYQEKFQDILKGKTQFNRESKHQNQSDMKGLWELSD